MASPTTPDSNLQFSFGSSPHSNQYQWMNDDAPEAILTPIEGGRTRADLPTFDLLSDEPLPDFLENPYEPPPISLQNEATSGSSSSEKNVGQRQRGEIWLDRGVVMCACPDCLAPMTIRIWLMTADCWRCGVSVELTEEQERQVRQLLEDHHKSQAPALPPNRNSRRDRPSQRPRQEPRQKTSEPSTPPQPRPRPLQRRSPPAPPPLPPQLPPPPSTPDRPASRRPLAAESRVQHRIRQASSSSHLRRALSEFFKMTPAWLISMIFHCIMLTLLALLTLGDEPDRREILLSASIAPQRREGGEKIHEPQEEAVFSLPAPSQADLKNQQVRETLLKADQQARELRIDPHTPDPNLPDLEQVKKQIGMSAGVHRAYAARDPRLRVEMVVKEGGTTLTEAAVARGLRWLAKNQNRDGSWSLHRFGGVNCDAAGTSLALMAFLGAGQTHLVGIYQENVSKGLRSMVRSQRDDGDLRNGQNGQPGMYAHGQATIVLCEAFVMTGDEQLREPAQKAVDFIVAAQHPGGGWRYRPGEAGDTSVVGWQLMALQSARAARLEVPQHTLELAEHYLDEAKDKNSPQYCYQPRGRANEAMTAEAILCRMYLGWRKDTPGLDESVEYLIDRHLPKRSEPNIYYWYYGTQAMHHYGGEYWERWNAHMRDILVETQEDRGEHAGSWRPVGPHSQPGGRIYMTALAICSLEVYYRHLPIFRQIDLDEPEH